MEKKINRIKKINICIYTFFIITCILIQILYFNKIEIENNVLGFLIVFNAYIIFIYTINNLFFVSFLDKKISRFSKVHMIYKYALFIVINVLITNQIQFNLVYTLLILLFLILSIIDNVSLKIFYDIMNNSNEHSNQDLVIENRDNRIKTWNKSESFRRHQYSLIYFFLSIIMIYISNFFTNFLTAIDFVLFGLFFSLSLLTGMIYLLRLSEQIKIKWYEYILFELFYVLVLLLIYNNMTFLIVFAFIPIISIIKKENTVRKKFLSDNYDKQ